MIFPKIVPRPLGVLKHVVLGCFQPLSTYISPCKFPKSVEGGGVVHGAIGRGGMPPWRAKQERKGFGEGDGVLGAIGTNAPCTCAGIGLA